MTFSLMVSTCVLTAATGRAAWATNLLNAAPYLKCPAARGPDLRAAVRLDRLYVDGKVRFDRGNLNMDNIIGTL